MIQGSHISNKEKVEYIKLVIHTLFVMKRNEFDKVYNYMAKIEAENRPFLVGDNDKEVLQGIIIKKELTTFMKKLKDIAK